MSDRSAAISMAGTPTLTSSLRLMIWLYHYVRAWRGLRGRAIQRVYG